MNYKEGEFITATEDRWLTPGQVLFKKGESYEVTYASTSENLVGVAYGYNADGSPKSSYYSIEYLSTIFACPVDDAYERAMGIV